MIYLYTKYDHYVFFIEKHKTDRLMKNLKISTHVKSGVLIKEILNNPIKTEYNIEYIDNRILISFNSESNNKYRLDIFPIIEEDKSIDPINHISFSRFENSIDDEFEYENETGLNEMIEILNRIHYILKDLLSNDKINNYFCIGFSKSLRKNNIYKYALKIIVGDGGFDKLPTDIYPLTKFGLYFKV